MRWTPCNTRSMAPGYATCLYAAISLGSLAASTSVAGELPRIEDSSIELEASGSDDAAGYEPSFGLFDQGIAGRANLGLPSLENNKPMGMNLDAGSMACYRLEPRKLFGQSKSAAKDAPQAHDDNNDDDDGDKVEDWQTVFLSANTCRQPGSKRGGSPVAEPPQLTLVIFDPADGDCSQQKIEDVSDENKTEFEEGATMFRVTGDKPVYVGIAAPKINKNEFNTDPYNFEIAASIDSWYHEYAFTDDNELLWMDSDSTSALLVTRNLTSEPDEFKSTMEEDPPYILFAENNDRNLMGGLRASYCGLRNTAQILANAKGDGMQHDLCRTSMTTRGPGGMPKQQFFFEKLNDSSSYTGILYKPASIGGSEKRQEENARAGGGVIFPAVSFQTSDSNSKVCQLMEGNEFDFCEDIQWGVPGNDDLNKTALAKKYDDYARGIYENFEKVMMQIPCDATPSEAYSLARNCDDCKKAYKRWLCTVSIPRCEGVFSNNTFAIPRNLGQPFPNGTNLTQEVRDSFGTNIEFQAARNTELNDEIKPGPYKEILPCDDICYEVMRSCPASIGFACPLPGMTGFKASYGRRAEDGSTDPLRCNSPGASRSRQNVAGVLGVTHELLAIIPLGVLFMSL